MHGGHVSFGGPDPGTKPPVVISTPPVRDIPPATPTPAAAAPNTMVGRRNDTAPHLMLPGDFGKWAEDGNDWYCRAPDGKLGNLSRHNIVEHDNGTITVSPSILIDYPPEGAPWHGFLEAGVWRSC